MKLYDKHLISMDVNPGMVEDKKLKVGKVQQL